jgi:putative Mn2+ efflux pump MntP
MRIILGLFFAVILTRFFYGKVEPLYIAGLAVFIIGMSYVTEYFRNKSRKKSQKKT